MKDKKVCRGNCIMSGNFVHFLYKIHDTYKCKMMDSWCQIYTAYTALFMPSFTSFLILSHKNTFFFMVILQWLGNFKRVKKESVQHWP